MTEFESYMVGLTALGVLLTSGGMLVGVTKGVAKVKEDTGLRIAEEATARDKAIRAEASIREAAIRELTVATAGKVEVQYRDFGETVSALRRFIEEVEGEMHRIEIWGRDHYVQEPLFQRTVDALVASMKEGFASIKGDLNTLKAELKEDITQARQETS
jgi:hypothetical protein